MEERNRVITTVKPTEWEVLTRQWLWQAKNPGVTEGIHPPFKPYYLRKLNETTDCQRFAPGILDD